MPSERSIFRKVQVVLDYCQPKKHNSVDELVAIIEKRTPASFVYYRIEAESDEVKPFASAKSILHAVKLCIKLELLHDTSGQLTKLGTSATDPRRFSRIIGNQTLELLKHNGLPLEKIEATIIEKILQNKPPLSPTAKKIWEELTPDLQFKDFASYMNILGVAGILTVEQKKIYLPRQ